MRYIDVMKIVFLDFDGVLSDETTRGGGLNPERVKLLNDLKGVKFVVTSTWRLNNDKEACTKILQDLGFEGEVFDITPSVISGRWRYRGIEIKQWIDDACKSGIIEEPSWVYDDYVILDDDSDMLYEQRNNFILVDGCSGITRNTIHVIKRKLKLFGHENIF